MQLALSAAHRLFQSQSLQISAKCNAGNHLIVHIIPARLPSSAATGQTCTDIHFRRHDVACKAPLKIKFSSSHGQHVLHKDIHLKNLCSYRQSHFPSLRRETLVKELRWGLKQPLYLGRWRWHEVVFDVGLRRVIKAAPLLYHWMHPRWIEPNFITSRIKFFGIITKAVRLQIFAKRVIVTSFLCAYYHRWDMKGYRREAAQQWRWSIEQISMWK